MNPDLQQRKNDCCPPRKPFTKKSFLGAASIFSAFGAAGLAGVGCLGCIPILGAALATSSFAALLDDNLVVLQISLVILSAALSYIYFRKTGCSKRRRILIYGAYLALAGNAAVTQNKIIALGVLPVLVIAHLLKRKDTDLKLLYFQGCPTYPELKNSLDHAGLNFRAIDIENLEAEDPLRRYSSPTLIFRDELLYGTSLSSDSMSCSYSSKKDMDDAVKKASTLSSKSSTS